MVLRKIPQSTVLAAGGVAILDEPVAEVEILLPVGESCFAADLAFEFGILLDAQSCVFAFGDGNVALGVVSARLLEWGDCSDGGSGWVKVLKERVSR